MLLIYFLTLKSQNYDKMKTYELFETLNRNTGKALNFVLPGDKNITGDLHITEVKNVMVESVDCGSNEHLFRETVIQLWVNESSGKQVDWTVGKALGILNKVGAKKKYDTESEVFFEFGDSALSTAKYSIDNFVVTETGLDIHLYVEPTVCKPSVAGNYACC